MENLDIKNFSSMSAVEDEDYVLLVTKNGAHGKISIDLIKKLFNVTLAPEIKDGYWWMNGTNTGVQAVGRTPEFRKGDNAIEFKYEDEPDSNWRTFLLYTSLTLRYQDLTEEEKENLKLHYADLTETEIQELQRPARDMIEILAETNDQVTAAEQARAKAEEERVQREEERTSQEQTRQQEEKSRKQRFDNLESDMRQNDSNRENRMQTMEQTIGTATETAYTQAERAKSYADHPNKIGENGNWLIWDEATASYHDTGIWAHGNIMFASFGIDTKTGELIAYYDTEYTGPTFELINGELFVCIDDGETEENTEQA